ncbi:MAG: pantoate--beta-alanine ligase [Oscillospiraceae bacterium]|jgi:pantoate--beta-alanine ligase|nr:pantoate--beta-alanine ligase [Oscillospiraceae bacterium]
MKIIKTVSEMISSGSPGMGFVPTMGYLHEGHLSLIRRSVSENEKTAVSIFVNPVQFAPDEDFLTYPRNLERDISLCEQAGADILFTPDADEMYPEGFQTYVDLTELTKGLCGQSRPGHFKGVCTAVAKLFNIIRPESAYFGQKDIQQLAVVRQMTADLNFGIRIVGCPTVREPDGLAMSSRNAYLSPEQRKAAVILSQSLQYAKQLHENGENDINILKNAVTKRLETEPLAKIDYVSNIEDVIAIAVFIGKTRLIDNICIGS